MMEIHRGTYRVTAIEPAGRGWHIYLRIPDLHIWSRKVWTDDEAVVTTAVSASKSWSDVEVVTKETKYHPEVLTLTVKANEARKA